MACTQWDKLSPNEFQQLQDLASCKFFGRLWSPDQIYILEFHSRLLPTQTRARSLKMFSRSFAGRRRQRLTNLIKMMWVFSRVQFELFDEKHFSLISIPVRFCIRILTSRASKNFSTCFWTARLRANSRSTSFYLFYDPINPRLQVIVHWAVWPL